MFLAVRILTVLALLLPGLALLLGPLEITPQLLPRQDACILHTRMMSGLGYRQLVQPRPFSEPEDLIGKLLRTSWRMAVSKPTFQLSESSDLLLFSVRLALRGLNPS